MQIRLTCGLQKLVKRLPWGEKPEYRHQDHTSVGDLVEKLEHFINFFALTMVIYVNLCKLGCSVILKM